MASAGSNEKTGARSGGLAFRTLPGGAFEVTRAGRTTTIDTSYRAIKEGMSPEVLKQLESADILDREDIRMIIAERTLERRLSKRERVEDRRKRCGRTSSAG
jgi:Cotton fibre expressed protein.